jgi:hypothetical protein
MHCRKINKHYAQKRTLKKVTLFVGRIILWMQTVREAIPSILPTYEISVSIF